MRESILAPQKRIGALSKMLKEIEQQLKVKIKLKTNVVELDGEGLQLYRAKMIVKAVARGFAPEDAQRLFDEQQQLEIIELTDLNQKKAERIKSRIIGTNGKTKYMIERFTECKISIYGKTISLIGGWEQIQNAKKAIEMFIRGAKHASVYGFLRSIKE